MARKPQIPNVNMLSDLHQLLLNSAIELRTRICIQCNWSIPTFYRKTRIDSSTEKADDMPQVPFSNADKEMIITLFDALLTEISQKAEKYRK